MVIDMKEIKNITALQRCPFKHGGRAEPNPPKLYQLAPENFVVCCPVCDGYGPSAESAALAVARWNDRAPRRLRRSKYVVPCGKITHSHVMTNGTDTAAADDWSHAARPADAMGEHL